MVDGKIVQEHDLFLKSNGWIGAIEYEPVPKYFTPKQAEGVILSYPDELHSEISDSKERLVTVYHFINDLGDASGDDFILQTSIRTTFNDKWAVCQAIRIYIIGTKGAMIIPFSRPGCSSDNDLMLNDLYLDGKEHDLSAFAANFDDFTSIVIKNKGQNVQVSVYDEVVYEREYQDSMGRFVGLRFKFIGLGEVEDVQLFDQENRPVEL
ncbi:MAG: hypothetical protein AAGF85_08475 [Bacteroidota bacterium]